MAAALQMTLEQMVDYVCSMYGQRDEESQRLCKLFIQKWYRAIWDSFPWKDTEMTATDSLEGGNVLNVPDGMDRVVAIRSNGDTYLDPTTIKELMETDPEIFSRHGLPTCYREYDDGVHHRIQVFPTPMTLVNLFIVGKRAIVQLEADGDEPILRNVTNCLLTYASGEFLKRQRHVDKAQAAFEEANAMLTAAQAVETTQANIPRRIKQLTASGNSLAEFTDQVAAQTGQWSLESRILIKNFLRSNYQAIWDAYNWSEATVCATVNNDGQVVVLPPYFDRVTQVRFDPNMPALEVVEPSLLFGMNAQVFEQTGTVVAFSYLTSVGVKFLPPTREKLTFYSTSMNDRSNVFVMGEVEGDQVSENVMLNGSLAVTTVNKYDTPLTISKNFTDGDVRVLGATSSDELVRILSNEKERKHMRIWLHRIPETAQVLLVLGKRTINPFAQDEDTTLLRDIGAALIAGASADMFSKLGDAAGATEQRKQYQEALKTLIDLENRQGAYSARVIPSVEYPCGEYEMTDWCVSKY